MGRFFFLSIGFSAYLGTIFFSAQAQDQARWAAPSLPVPPLAASEEALKAARMHQYMQDLYDQNQFNGVVLVAQKGRILYQGAWGWSNIAQKDTLNLDTPFRLASVSKQFTAMAIMILKEAGKLHYDEPITKYLPELPYSQISIRHLLHHNSGLPDYFGIGWSIQQFFPAGKLIDNADMLRYFSVRQPKLVFKPGQKASYSNTGYVFLASIVERVSGMPFAEFLDKNIFQPLGMKNTFVYDTKNYQTHTKYDTVLVRQDTVLIRENEMKIETILKVETHLQKTERRRAFGYDLSYPYPSGYIPLDYHAFDGINGEKGVCTSALDLLKWDQALHEHQLIRPETQAEAFRPSPVTDQKAYYYGFGWKIYRDRPHIVFHHGLYRGFRNYFHRNLRDQSTIIILSNRNLGGRVTQIYQGLELLLAGKECKAPKASRLEQNTWAEFKRNLWIDYGQPPR